MAFAGTRNAKALAWNSGSLEADAQSHRDRMGGERQEQETGETEGGGPAQREAPGESQGKRHRGTGAGAEQREITRVNRVRSQGLGLPWQANGEDSVFPYYRTTG